MEVWSGMLTNYARMIDILVFSHVQQGQLRTTN